MSKKFSDLLARVPPVQAPFGYKSAQDLGLESPDNTQFEQDFSRLAYMFVQDRAAPLMKYVLGFEVVNRDTDGSRAIGVFGFKIGPEYYYVPCFFLNNQIKGVDILFNKKTNMLVPLQEDWINHIVNRQNIELGGHADASKIQRDFENPNFRFMAVPPLYPNPSGETPKVAAADDTAWTLKEAWAHMEEKISTLLEKDAAFQQAWAGFVCRTIKAPLPFEKTAEGSPLKLWIRNQGGPRAMSSVLGAITTNYKYANAALTFYPDLQSLMVEEYCPTTMPEKGAAEIRVTTQVTDWVDGEAKKRLVRDGFTVVDKRPKERKSDTYDIDYEKRFSNPEQSGIYDVLLQDGRTTKCWVLLPGPCSREGAALVIEQDKRMYRLAQPEAIYCRGDQLEGPEAVFDKGVDLQDLEIGIPYCLVNKAGQGIGPVVVTSVIEDPERRTRLKVSWPYESIVKRPMYGRDFSTLRQPERHKKFDTAEPSHYCEPCSPSWNEAEYLELTDDAGKAKKTDYRTMVIPSNFKAIKLYERDGSGKTGRENEQVMEDLFVLGSLSNLDDAMQKSAFHRLTVASDDQGLQYYLRLNRNNPTPVMGYKQAYCELVGRLGLSIEDTEAVLKEASEQFKSRRLVKLAQQSSLVGVNMPPPRDATPATDPYTGIPMFQTPYEQNQVGSMTGLPPKPNANQYGINIGGEAEMDQQAQQLADQAAQAGQKQVFDLASIGGLSKSYDTGAMIDSYVPELMQALDRLGRILFLYYWKNEDFAERYGTGDIAEMEDLIRSVFKSFGELVLKLRQKSIDADSPNMIDSGSGV